MIRSSILRGSLRAGSFPLAVFVLHVGLSLFLDSYDRVSWSDIPVHLLGGAAIGWFFSEMILLMEEEGRASRTSWRAHAVMVFGLVALATVVWELGEFVWDRVTRMNVQRSIANVMSDQLMGLVGGAILIALKLPSLKSLRPERPRP